ncbi:hypothetical protein E1B28_005151 [Marasmius oreades]|uniref:SHSP domain-containing protein n=1 Tax=Marasmius oreades TaxID=181124 RepID=A0A9P7V058_9AGAR|nr:uncharacterized protein E1B28_005151 [Marasmius oreades]KAG7097833.1 hypothetical protein E1B28_005151 [Marasmius oreades]
MSYSYGHGEYHNESASALSSSSQLPQWETLEQHHTEPQQQPQQQSEIVLSPTQPIPFFPMADEYLTTDQLHQLHSPTDPHHSLLSHRSSYDSTSDGRFNSLSPGDIGTPTSTSADPTTNPSRSRRGGRQALRRVQTRAMTNPYPPSSMHAMQPPPLPTGREHRVGDSTPAMHRSPPAITTSPTTPILGSPMAGAQSGGYSEANRISPYSPSGNVLPPPPTPPTGTSISTSEHPVPAQVQRPQAQSQPRRRLIPRADMHYDPQSHVLSVSMELPGVKKAELRLTLSTCLFNRVRQLTVKGRSDPVFANGSSSLVGNNTDGSRAPEGDGDTAMDAEPRGGGGQGDTVGGALYRYAVRERKYGDFSRILNVPSETRPEDIQAEMENGVLTLKIVCGPPAESPDTQVVPIR